jgi:hypothetical protein
MDPDPVVRQRSAEQLLNRDRCEEMKLGLRRTRKKSEKVIP